MPHAGQVVFSRLEEVHFGKPAAETVAELACRQQAERVFLMVSGTLNRETDEIERLRRALGNHCVGTFDRTYDECLSHRQSLLARQSAATRS